MGLDQYIYRTTKKRWKAHLEFKKLSEKYFGLVSKMEADIEWKKFLESLPRRENPRYDSDYDFDKFTKEHKNFISRYKKECRNIAKSIGMKVDKQLGPKFEDRKYGLSKEEDPVDEIMYWRKNWDLHKYIIDNFWPDKEHDNLVDIPLTRKDIKKMIKDGMEVGTFREILKELDKDHVVYYWPWY